VDINKLSMPEKVIAASGILLFIASFLTWFEAEIGDFVAVSWNGWNVPFLVGPLPVLLGLVMLAHVIISNFAEGVKLPELPWAKVHMVAGIAAGALLVLKLLVGEDPLDRSFGLFIAVIAGIGLAAGGFLYNKEHSDTATTM